MSRIEFWFSIGSTYSYLTVMRLDAYATLQGLEIVWRPFNVREIMIEQNNIPFANKPVKSAYMWRDIERRATRYGLPIKVPAPYPLEQLPLANQIAILGMEEDWGRRYVPDAFFIGVKSRQSAIRQPDKPDGPLRHSRPRRRGISRPPSPVITPLFPAASRR